MACSDSMTDAGRVKSGATAPAGAAAAAAGASASAAAAALRVFKTELLPVGCATAALLLVSGGAGELGGGSTVDGDSGGGGGPVEEGGASGKAGGKVYTAEHTPDMREQARCLCYSQSGQGIGDRLCVHDAVGACYSACAHL